MKRFSTALFVTALVALPVAGVSAHWTTDNLGNGLSRTWNGVKDVFGGAWHTVTFWWPRGAGEKTTSYVHKEVATPLGSAEYTKETKVKNVNESKIHPAQHKEVTTTTYAVAGK